MWYPPVRTRRSHSRPIFPRALQMDRARVCMMRRAKQALGSGRRRLLPAENVSRHLVKDRRGKANRVDAVEYAAVAFDEGPIIAYAAVALDGGHRHRAG